jgi:hypothetical protein
MVKLMGDPTSAFTKALGVELTHPGPCGVLGAGRCGFGIAFFERAAMRDVPMHLSPAQSYT